MVVAATSFMAINSSTQPKEVYPDGSSTFLSGGAALTKLHTAVTIIKIIIMMYVASCGIAQRNSSPARVAALHTKFAHGQVRT